MKLPFPRLLQLAALAVLTVLTGCSRGPKIVKVSGTVTRHGRPVPNLLINFQPEHGRLSSAFTDDQGRYTLTYDPQHAGALVGRHKVYVEFWPRSAADELLMAQGKLKLPRDLSDILKKYGERTTPLYVEVKNERNQVIDLQLD